MTVWLVNRPLKNLKIIAGNRESLIFETLP
jgi:hypothetical protein